MDHEGSGYYHPRPGDLVCVNTKYGDVVGRVICFYLGTVTVETAHGIVLAGKRKVRPVSALPPRSSYAGQAGDMTPF